MNPSSSASGDRAPYISVVVAVKNGAATLPQCLSSIFGQHGSSLETVVIDGASTDGTISIIEKHASQIAHWRSEPDTGVYSAWNKALGKTRGEWICFLGADDKFHDDRVMGDLERAARTAPADVHLLYGRLNLVTREGRLAETVGRPWAECRDDFLAGFMLPHPGMLHHRSIFEKHGGFDPSYRIAGDYELLLRELAHGNAQAQFVDRVIVDMQIGGASARPDTIWRALREVVHARNRHGLHSRPRRLRLAILASRIGAIVHATLGERVFNYCADAYRRLRGKPPLWTA